MDFVPWIDRIGEVPVALGLGLILGMAFGGLAFASGLCTRAAVIDLACRNARMDGLTPWLLAIGSAVLGTQALIWTGAISVAEVRFLAFSQSIAGPTIGGALFGIGMILTRGCASRLLVLSGSGNLRAVLTIVVIATTGWMAMAGPLSSLRVNIAGIAPMISVGPEPALSPVNAALVAVSLLSVGMLLFRRGHIMAPVAVFSLALGALVPLGWFLVHSFSQQVFDPIMVESYAFIRPLSDVAGAGYNQQDMVFGVDHGILAGTVLGALIVALITRRFVVQTFSSAGSAAFWRYPVGGVLMGFGGVLAGGCTIGVGFTGGSVMAMSAILALASIMATGVVTHRLLDERAAPEKASVTLIPAE